MKKKMKKKKKRERSSTILNDAVVGKSAKNEANLQLAMYTIQNKLNQTKVYAKGKQKR